MRDVTGGYEYCFYCMGTCMVLGGVPLLVVPFAETPNADSTIRRTKGSRNSNGTSD